MDILGKNNLPPQPGMPLHMQHAVAEDAEAVSRLIGSLSLSFTLHPSGQGAEGFMGSISAEALRRCITAPNFAYFKGLIGNELAGVVALRDNGHLYHLFVRQDLQGRGLARILWTFARQQAEAAGNPGIFTVNSFLAAVPVYERFGFRATGSRVETMGIAYVPMRLDNVSA